MKRSEVHLGAWYVVGWKRKAIGRIPATHIVRVCQLIQQRTNGRSVVSYTEMAKNWDRTAGTVHDTFAGRIPFWWTSKNHWVEVSDTQIIRAATADEFQVQLATGRSAA